MAVATAHYVEEQHPRGPHGEWVKKYLPQIKSKAAPKSFKFYKQGYKPKPKASLTGTNVHMYGKRLHQAKAAGHFQSDYEFWLAAGKLHTEAKKKHGANAPKPHAIVNSAFHHEIESTGKLTMLDSGVPQSKPTKNVHGKTPGGIKLTSKFLAPGQLKYTGQQLSGVNGARIYEDDKGVKWIVKVPGGWKGTSKAYSNNAFLADLDVATSRIQNKAGLPVPAMHAKDIGDGRIASVQKMYSRVQPIDFGKLSDADVHELQKNMVVDWLLSNHDAHSGNFLRTDKGIIGIDKGQSFKYFGKDKLTPNFGSDLNPPLAPNKPVYSALMKNNLAQMQPWDSGEFKTEIDRIQAIPDDEYRKLLEPYVKKAKAAGLLSYPGKSPADSPIDAEDKFMAAAIARKNNLANDFDNLWNQLHPDELPDSGSLPNLTDEQKKAEHAKVAAKLGKLDAKVKIPGEKASFDSVQIGDKISYGGKVSEVVGVGTNTISTSDGGLYQKTPFNLGYVTWADPKAAVGGGGPSTNPDIPAGYKIVPHPTESGKFTIQKPTGEFSKNPEGIVKSWQTEDLAKYSSTMKKYANQALQQAQAGMYGAQSFANSAPDNDPNAPGHLQGSDAMEYAQIKAKIMLGQDFTPDEYMKLKGWANQIKNAAKAAGAAQVEEDFTPEGWSVPIKKAAKKTKGGFKEQPKFKKHGGEPPTLESQKGPNVLALGEKLYQMKKDGKIADDFQMWNEAAKLSNADKKAAGPGAKVGDGYSSKNAIRNVAMRLEYDETGDVVWETTAEKTSEEIGQTVGEMKKTLASHDHKPVVKASAAQSMPAQATAFAGHFDSNAEAGSYLNPHSFKQGDTQALQAYGYKYTDHKIPWAPNQKSAWYNFSGSGYQNVNTFFRTGEVGMFGNLEDAKKRAKGIVDAFKSDNVKPLEDWTIVTRGTNGGWEFGIGSDSVTFDQLEGMVGKVVRNKCPVSSSLRGRPAFSGAHRITYKLPPGFKGLGIYGHSAHSSENEMILPPGMAYRILEVKKSNDYGFQNDILVEVVDVKLPEIT